jgi:hypothetical protein
MPIQSSESTRPKNGRRKWFAQQSSPHKAVIAANGLQKLTLVVRLWACFVGLAWCFVVAM